MMEIDVENLNLTICMLSTIVTSGAEGKSPSNEDSVLGDEHCHVVPSYSHPSLVICDPLATNFRVENSSNSIQLMASSPSLPARSRLFKSAKL